MAMEEFKPAKGVYAMHHMNNGEKGSLVLITEERITDGRGKVFGISYVPSGGASFYWEESEFRPVKDPHLIAICKNHAAQRKLKELKQEIVTTEAEIVKWAGVIEVFKEAAAKGEK